MATLDNEDLINIGKAAKNNVRIALDTFELGEGQPLHELLDAEIDRMLSAVQGIISQRNQDDNWYVWEKIAQGTDHPTGMNAVQLQAALLRLFGKGA